MTRLIFPDEGSRLVYRAVGSSLLTATGVPATFYSDAAGTILADLRVYDGTNTPGAAVAGSVLTTDAYSRLPLFWGPDSTDTVYAKIAGAAAEEESFFTPVPSGPIVPVYARTDDRLDALSTSSSTNTAAIASEATTRAAADATNATAAAAAQTTANAAYVKPGPGIPSTDMAASVVTSLGRADSAAQRAELVTNVKSPAYGAIGDGVADDTAAITAARNATPAGGVIYFPPGTYLHTGLASGHTNETWRLEPAAKLLLANAANAHCLTVTHAGFTVVGGIIDGNRANQSSTTVNGIFASLADDATVLGVTVQNINNRGIYNVGGNRFNVSRCHVTGTRELPIYSEPTTSADIVDITYFGNRVDRSAEGAGIVEGGIKIHGTVTNSRSVKRARITDNTVIMPILAAGTNSSAVSIEMQHHVDGGVVASNTTIGGSMGVSIADSVECVVNSNSLLQYSFYGVEMAAAVNTVVSSNLVDAQGNAPVGIVQSTAGSNQCTVIGNTVLNTTQDGVVINASNETTVTGNFIKMPIGSRWAINVGGNPLYVTITGNMIDSSATDYSMNIAPVSYIAITGNVLVGNGLGLKGIAVDRSVNVTITGNMIRNYTQHGILLFAQSAFTINNVNVVGNSYNSVGTTFGFQLSGGGVLGSNIWVFDAQNGGLTTTLATKTANYSLLPADGTILANGVITVTLPAAATTPNGRRYTIKNITGASVVTVASVSGTVDTTTIAAGLGRTYVTDQTAWWSF